MSWRPVKSIVHAVCTYRFEATDADDLGLELGDNVYITEIGGPTQEWCRGWLLSQPSILDGLLLPAGQPLKPRAYSGIFPRTHVEFREVLGDDRFNSPNTHVLPRLDSDVNGSNGDELADAATGASQAGSAEARATLSRSRSFRRTRLFYRRLSDAELEPLDVMPRRQDAPKDKAPLPALRIGDATNFSVEEPLVDEISSCLREWYSTKLHHLLLDHEYTLVENVSGLVKRLDNARKQLIHDLLTEKELAALRESTIWDLVDGNKMMDGGVIVRDPTDKGRILTAQDNIPNMLKLQAMMSLRTRPPPVALQESTTSHILAEVKHFPDTMGETSMLHMYLCRAVDGKPRPVSEVFAIEVPLDMPGSISHPSSHSPRTLFTDLTKAEIGSATDPSSRLYLVCLLQRDEPFRTESRRPLATPTQSSGPQDRSDISLQGENSNGGRRSFLFGSQRGRKLSQEQLRPMSPESSRSRLQKPRTITPAPSESQSRPSTAEKPVRRTVGYSAIEVGALIRQQEHSELSLMLWTPARPSDDIDSDPVPGVEGWEDVLRTMVRSPTGRFKKLASTGPFKLYLHAFAHLDAPSLIKEYPAMLQHTHCTQALNVMSSPQTPRSDIYLTLKEPLLPPGARCFHPQDGSVPIAADTGLRNLQLTLEVRSDSGRRIENSICPTSNRSPHTAFRTPAVDRGEPWNQTIRLSIPTEEVPGAHVVMSIADGSHFPFALAWLPLWNRETDSCQQGPQRLALWDYSEYTASTLHGRGAYQSLPSHLDQLPAQEKSILSALLTSITVSSSVNAQDPNISALLNWDGTTVEGLMEVLEGFKVAPDTEIVKFFEPILAALDRIFETFYGLSDDMGAMIGELFAERALSCLVHALHLTHDRRFSTSKDRLEEYIAGREPSPNALKAVSRAFRAVLGRPYDVEEARELRSVLKVSGQIIKFITNNHHNAIHQSSPVISNPLTSVQNAALNLMRNPREAVYGTQVMLMQNFASWLPELGPVSPPDDILEFIEEMMTASATKKGSLHIIRLVMLKEALSLEAFKGPDMRRKILLKTRDWIEPYWSTSEVVTEHQLECIRMCCSIIESQQSDMAQDSLYYIVKLFEAYHLLEAQVHEQHNNGRTSRMSQARGKKTFSLPFPKSYPFHSMSVDTALLPKEVLLEIATLLTSFFQNGPPLGDVREYVMGEEDTLELFVTRVLQVLQSVQNGKAIPAQWLSLYVSHAKCAVTTLQWVLDILLTTFLPSDDFSDIMSFNNEVWGLWFKTLIELTLNKTVSMEDFSEQTSRAIWTIGGDIREAAALLLRYGWESLGWKVSHEYEKAIYPMTRMGGFQVGLTSKLIPSAVRLCMGLHSGLRSAGLDMIRSMIVSEWQLNENLDFVQGAFFDAFDLLAHQNGPLGKSFTSAFLEDLRVHFTLLRDTSESALYDAIVKMIKEVEKLLGVLGELTVVKDAGSQLIQLYYLTDFLRLSGKDEAYIRRLHELSQLLVQTRNYSSAAFAVQMHVNLIDQDKSDEGSSRVLPRVVLPGIELADESAHARKIKLFRLMAIYYEKGHCWENVLDVLKQLADTSRAVWDVGGLATTSEEKSRVYRLLAKGPNYTPRYFHVAFTNHELFPFFVRGKQFIFEGPADCDRRSFCQHLHAQFPSAANLASDYAHPPLHGTDAGIKVSPVTPYKDHLHPINQQSGVASQYREHCLTLKPRTFAITSRHDVPQVSVADQVVEKTVYATQDTFPTLLSYSEVIGENRLTLSPLQAAIDRTQRKTQILSVATERATSKGVSELDTLIENVRASVNPDASNSVVEYHKLLIVPPESSDDETVNGYPHSLKSTSMTMGGSTDGRSSEDTLLRRALSVALEDHARSIEAALALPVISTSTKSQIRTFFQATFTLELHTMYPSGDWQRKSPAWIDLPDEKTVSAKEERNNDGVTAEADRMERKSSHGRRLSLRKRLSFLSIGGKSLV